MAELFWWGSFGGGLLVGFFWWRSFGGARLVELVWWRSLGGGLLVEVRCGVHGATVAPGRAGSGRGRVLVWRPGTSESGSRRAP